MNRYLMIFLYVVFLSSCTNTEKDEAQDLNLFSMTSNPDNPGSIFLRLVDRTEGDTSVSYAARALFHQDTVGFILEVSKAIPAGINNDGSVDEDTGFNKGWITFRRSGAESDRFASALAELWQVDGVSKMAEQPIQPLVFSSNRTAVDLDKPSTSSFKLFFDEAAASPGELFFTFDTYRRSIEFQEKGTEYRSRIARAFTD